VSTDRLAVAGEQLALSVVSPFVLFTAAGEARVGVNLDGAGRLASASVAGRASPAQSRMCE